MWSGSIPFFQDENVPQSVADWLTQRGHVMTRVVDLIPPGSPDTLVTQVAEANGLVILTYDRDFLQRQHSQAASMLVLDFKPPTRALNSLHTVIELIEAHYQWCRNQGRRYAAALTRTRYTVYL